MMRRAILLAALGAAVAAGRVPTARAARAPLADDAGRTAYVLRVNLTDGTSDEYLVAARPFVRGLADSVRVEVWDEAAASSLLTAYAAAAVRDYTFADVSATAIETPAADSADTGAGQGGVRVTCLDGQTVTLRLVGAAATDPSRRQAAPTVYDASGQRVAASVTLLADGAVVSLAAQPRGIYLINIYGKTIKIARR